MALEINITNLIKPLAVISTIGLLATCGTIKARLAELPTTRVTTLSVDQPCTASAQNEKRLAGAYLRQSDATGLTFVPVLVTGRENRNGLAQEVTLVDESQTQAVPDERGTIAVGRQDALAKARTGFGKTDTLPNVYDVTFDTREFGFRGPMVLGPGVFLNEIPGSGARLFSGTVSLTLITQDDEGNQTELATSGRFALQAGYGSARGSFTANGFDKTFSFDTLQWTNLFLCGTRFVSSGQGTVTVQQDGGPALPPFKQDRETATFAALFESSLLAPKTEDRLGPPVGIGGVFVIKSDKGTMTAVFLSDQPQVFVEEVDETDA